MGLGNIIIRRLKVFIVALLIYIDYKVVQKRVRWANESKKNEIWKKTNERNARRILNFMIEMKGLWVKYGQYLSTRADVLPPSYVSCLKQLQDSLPPRPLKEVCKTIEKEMGKLMDDLFTRFDHTPLATASIAQVHRATMKDGREVVVKVQHNGIKEIILEDLKNAKSIVDWIAWSEPEYDMSCVIDEWCREAPKELDFNNEAENTRTVARNLKRNNNSDPNSVDVLIPEVIQSTEKILILEYMDGIRLNDKASLESHGVNKQKLVQEITRAFAHQIYIDGFFNGDPHPGNFLVSKEAPHRPILLDFGLTKRISSSMKQALAKMFLASTEGDQVALLSAFAQMGLKLRVDMPEQALEVVQVFFRNTATANEARKTNKNLQAQREKRRKALKEKLNLNEKQEQRFNPIDAFPSDALLFARVLELLRGLSRTLNVQIVYLDIMKPFAESTLQGSLIKQGDLTNSNWIYNTPVHSEVESKLRKLLLKIGSDKILGIQVCAYKEGKVIIDTAAGFLGKYDPRPVKPDALFPVFSVTKGITSSLVHWLVDKGKLRYDQNVADIWPQFGNNKKESIKVHHVLNHTSGLHASMSDVMRDDPFLFCDWDEALNQISNSTPETEPGSLQTYHYLSFGWLCGGIIENASGKKFQEVLEEAIIRPLNLQGELYIGIPPGVESRLATLTIDREEIQKLAQKQQQKESSITAQMASALPMLFNTLNIRRAIIPAANGHCSARALARYYAALAVAGQIPPSHSAHYNHPLGSHTHVPKFPSSVPPKKKSFLSNFNFRASVSNHKLYIPISIELTDSENGGKVTTRIFENPKFHDACMGLGEYENLIYPNGEFGLGFRRYKDKNGKFVGFGHSGIGGSIGYCDLENNFAIAITVNKMSFTSAITGRVIGWVCEELGISLPDEFTSASGNGPDMQLNVGNRLNLASNSESRASGSSR